MSPVGIPLDTRDAPQIVAALLARRPGYVPEWLPAHDSADVAVLQIAARYVHAVIQRLNQAPDKNKLAFLDLLGLDLITAQAARVPVVFNLHSTAPDAHLPAGARVVAPPPPGSTQQIVFETQRAAGLAAGKLVSAVSLWPGRDQCIDHSAALQARRPFQPFHIPELQDIPHALYIAHDTLLALSAKSTLDVAVELVTPGSSPLGTIWEYWDGEVWRAFKAMRPECGETGDGALDGTNGLTRSGRFRLETDCAQTQQATVNGTRAFWIRGRLTEPLPPDPHRVLPEVGRIQLATVIERSLVEVKDNQGTHKLGFPSDYAFADATTLDLTKPFYPFGLQPQPGAAFYFSSQEVFSKPGASVSIYVERTSTPQDSFGGSNSSLVPKLSWEYWDGRRWSPFEVSDKDPFDLNPNSGKTITLTVPDDMAKTTVNGQEGLWMRVNLVSGGFGFKQSVTVGGSTFKYVFPRPPALSAFSLGYAWQHGPYAAEHVYTYNDFQYEDHTEQAKWPGKTFKPFTSSTDATPALFLGFDKKLPEDYIGLLFDIVEQPSEAQGPALVWEYWDGVAWQHLSVDDETANLRIPGMVSFIAASDSRPLARFGTPLHWIRGRLKEDGPPGAPTVNGIFANAVWAVQHQTITDEPLGTSTGQADQEFFFTQIPVLPGERVEVRELSGARANVEWRILAREVLGGGDSTIQQLEDLVSREGSQTDIEMGDLRLRRDRNKRIAEVWVRWYGRLRLYQSGPDDRVYMLERARGRLIFGSLGQGKIPPLGAAIVAQRYLTGGGQAGNVSAGAITQLQSAVGGIESVTNPRPAEGGTDAETLEALGERGPRTLRHRGRALGPEDYEAMAKEAAPAVAVARAIAPRDPSGRPVPGWVTLVIIPQSTDPRPWPSFGLREEVRSYLATRAPSDVAAANQIFVTGPQYLAVDVAATIVPVVPAEAGDVAVHAREAVVQFLHPLLGGQNRRGWPPGRSVYLSDLATVLESVAGVDHVEELMLFLGGNPQGALVPVAADQTVVAGDVRLKLKGAGT